MVNSQSTESYLRLANNILEELILRDFTRRQRRIVDLIIRVSWGCNRAGAVIPELKYFEICGIHKPDIREELEFLEQNLIIHWNRGMNLFEVNKNFDQWKIPYSRLADKARISKLVNLNLNNDDTFSVSKILTQLVKNTNSVSKKYEPAQSRNARNKDVADVPIYSLYKKSLYRDNLKNFSSRSIEATKILIEEQNSIERSSPIEKVKTREDAVSFLLNFPISIRYHIDSNRRLMQEYGISPEDLP